MSKQIIIHTSTDLLNFIQLECITTKQAIQVVSRFLKVNILFDYINKDEFINDVKKHIEKFTPYQTTIFLLTDAFEFHSIKKTLCK